MSDDLNGVMRGVMVVMFLGVGLVICAKTDERAKICLSTQSIALGRVALPFSWREEITLKVSVISGSAMVGWGCVWDDTGGGKR